MTSNQPREADFYLTYDLLGEMLTERSIREQHIDLTQTVSIKEIELEEDNILTIRVQVSDSSIH